MVKVKICGLKRPVDIESVNTEKPDYIGFVFAESKRKVTPERAAELRKLLNCNIIPVGVFVDESIENIFSMVYNNVIDVIQLHGSESEEYIRELKQLTGKPVIKASGNSRSADFLLFDNAIPGSGQMFDWATIEKTDKPFFLAGGLHAGNVTEAIKKNAPYAVDVSSGVETGGVKDPAKIKEFIRRARNEY
ncbi:MAG: phosphoribosylanthranilate isomerase [Oscillospiraceae bacterium]|jgi:phosphoribosylanthranilate isomerase|nr:phosphoribosylanthranilate isomerase [Oscillospiraceae bacterium]